MQQEESLKYIVRKMQEYNPKAKVGLVKKAFDFGLQKYSYEKSKQNFGFGHNIGVGTILVDIKADTPTIAAGLLHNMYVFGVGRDELKKEFGEDIANLIENRNKFEIGLLKANPDRIEQTKKLFLALTKDPRLILIELAERLELLRRLGNVLPAERSQRLLDEAHYIYIPFAHKLGIDQIKSEMEDLSLKYDKPEIYNGFVRKVDQKKKKRDKEIEQIKKIIGKKISEAEISAKIYGRAKSLYSIYDKMQRKNKGFEEIHDLNAIRIITNSVRDCYGVLGLVHSIWKPLPKEFDDYIAKPKPNGYQSLHTTVLGAENKLIEIQIRTQEMEDVAELGIAAHWKYKGGKEESYDKRLALLKEILDWKRESEAGDSLRVNIFENEIFVLTPKGEIIELPDGATALDFAYAVHTELGHKCSKVKVNGRLVPLDYCLGNADLVEILPSNKQQPKAHWLNIVKTDRARAKIKQKLKIGVHQKDIKKGLKKEGALISSSNSKKIRLAKCCSPVPGDDVVGYLTTKRKISVHRRGCEEGKKFEGKNKMVEVDWGPKTDKSHLVNIEVIAKERVGLLKDILNAYSSSNVNIVSTNAKIIKNNMATCSFEIKTKNLKQLQEIIEKTREINGVVDVERR